MGSSCSQNGTKDEENGRGNEGQIDDKSHEMYKLINLKGGGELIVKPEPGAEPLTDEEIVRKVKPYLNCSDGGKKTIPIAELVEKRHKDRRDKHKILQYPPDDHQIQPGMGSSNKVGSTSSKGM